MPAFGRQGLEWVLQVKIQIRRVHFGVDTFWENIIFGKNIPDLGFLGLSNANYMKLPWKTMEINQKPYKTMKNNETTLKNHGKQPWNYLEKPWKQPKTLETIKLP